MVRLPIEKQRLNRDRGIVVSGRYLEEISGTGMEAQNHESR